MAATARAAAGGSEWLQEEMQRLVARVIELEGKMQTLNEENATLRTQLRAAQAEAAEHKANTLALRSQVQPLLASLQRAVNTPMPPGTTATDGAASSPGRNSPPRELASPLAATTKMPGRGAAALSPSRSLATSASTTFTQSSSRSDSMPSPSRTGGAQPSQTKKTSSPRTDDTASLGSGAYTDALGFEMRVHDLILRREELKQRLADVEASAIPPKSRFTQGFISYGNVAKRADWSPSKGGGGVAGGEGDDWVPTDTIYKNAANYKKFGPPADDDEGDRIKDLIEKRAALQEKLRLMEDEEATKKIQAEDESSMDDAKKKVVRVKGGTSVDHEKQPAKGKSKVNSTLKGRR